MNKMEALALLTLAAQYDPTMLPATEDDQDAKAAVWANALSAVPFAVACEAVGKHYAKSDSSITIAALNIHAEREQGGETQVTIPTALPECRECGTPYQRDYADEVRSLSSPRCVGCGNGLVLVEAPSVNAGSGFRQFMVCIDCGRQNQVGKHPFCVCGAPVPDKKEHGAMLELPKRGHLDDPMALSAVVRETRDVLAKARPDTAVGPLTREDLVRLRAIDRARADKRGKPFDVDAWRGPNGEPVPEVSRGVERPDGGSQVQSHTDDSRAVTEPPADSVVVQ
jgi:hypothetical protein